MMAARSGHGGRNSAGGGQGVPSADWVGASWRERSVVWWVGQWQTGTVRRGEAALGIERGRD